MLTSRSNGGTPVTSRAVEQDPAGGRQLEAGDHPQGRGLARAGRAEHREELAVADVEVDAVDRDDVAIALLDALEADRDGASAARSCAAPAVADADRQVGRAGRDGREPDAPIGTVVTVGSPHGAARPTEACQANDATRVPFGAS